MGRQGTGLSAGPFEPGGGPGRLTVGRTPRKMSVHTGPENTPPQAISSRLGYRACVMDRPRQISIIVADDHPIVLRGVLGVLQPYSDMHVLATCSSGPAALQAIRELAPEVAILDVAMPELDGLAVLSSLGQETSTRVVLLTATATAPQLMTAIVQGARGIVLKDGALRGLVDCIREVAAGRLWFPADLVNEALEPEIDPPHNGACNQALTSREREVMMLVAEGLSNKQVGRRLNLTEGTIKIHLHNIYSKVGVPNRTALAALAIDNRERADQ